MARNHSDEKRAAVIAALLQGQSVSYVAKQYDIPRSTVSSWKRRHARGELQDASEKNDPENIGRLVMAYLASSLEALRVQTVAFSDPEWLAQQSAEDVAVLHGVMMDKAARLLELLNGPAGD